MNSRLLPCLLALLPAALLGQPADPSRRGDGRSRADDRRDERGRPDYRDAGRERPRVILYEHADFRGGFFILHPGDEVGNFAGGTFQDGGRLNDRVSSIRIEGDAELFVYADSRFRGHVMRVTEDIRDLSVRPTPDPRVTWNDRISSAQVGRERRPAGGRPADADVLVRRAYEDILGRAVDPEGLRHYRGLVIDQGWTERMVRDHLRASAEYRGAGIDRLVTRAYHDLLGRAPDPAGLAQYRRLMIERDWSEVELRDAIRRSDEYRKRARMPGGGR